MSSPVATPNNSSPIPPQQAARFLQQASFSSTTGQISQLQSQGYEAWLNSEFSRPVSGSSYDWLLAHGYFAEEFITGFAGAASCIWQRLIASPDVLRQRVALALSEFFVVSAQGLSMLPYRQFVLAAW